MNSGARTTLANRERFAIAVVVLVASLILIAIVPESFRWLGAIVLAGAGLAYASVRRVEPTRGDIVFGWLALGIFAVIALLLHLIT